MSTLRIRPGGTAQRGRTQVMNEWGAMELNHQNPTFLGILEDFHWM